VVEVQKNGIPAIAGSTSGASILIDVSLRKPDIIIFFHLKVHFDGVS
jgi:hypothetical protein